MDALDALLDYAKAVSPVLAAAAGVSLTGDCATDVGAIATKMGVPYEGPTGLPDALVACLGKLGSDFDDAKKRDVMNAVSDKNLTRAMQELGKPMPRSRIAARGRADRLPSRQRGVFHQGREICEDP